MANPEIIVDEPGVANQPKSRYSLVVLAAKRARQLKDGAPPLVEPTSPNLLTTALQEIAAGKIGIIEAAEQPDDEAPHYSRGGFIASEYDDIINDVDLSPGDLSDEDDSDTEILTALSGASKKTKATDVSVEES